MSEEKTAKKAISLDELQHQVRDAIREQFGFDDMALVPWVAELYDEFVVVEMNEGEYWQVPYTTGEDGVTFAGREDWTKVKPERVWVETKQKALARKAKKAPCKYKAIKVIDEDTRRIGAYATIWGELDCDGDRMTRQALEPYVGKAVPMMFWLHGLDKEFKANPVGVWDDKTFKADSVGLFVEGNVGRDYWGDKAWDRIEAAKSFGLSVGSFWYLVQRKALSDGTNEITDWPLVDISLMEGGKQCVPNAQRTLEPDLKLAYNNVALKLGFETESTGDGGPVDEYELELGGLKMSNENEATVDINQTVAEAVTAALAKRDEEEAAKQKQQQEIEAKAQEIAQAEIDKAKAEHEQELEQAKADHEQELEKANKNRLIGRPQAPPVKSEGVQPNPVIFGISPYDRQSTMDLCIKYELMRSYGKKPSQQFFNALGDRAAKMAREEDQLFIKNGQPVKVPAIDWDVLVPRNLDLAEVDGEVFGVKAGQFDRFQSGGFDSAADNVTPRGLKQFTQLASGAVKANEITYSTQANSGDEWVPTLMQAQLWRTVRINAAVLSQFQQFDMPSNPYDYPIESTDPTFYKVGESTDESQLVLTGGPFTDSKVGTGKVTFSAGKLGAISYWSEEMEEDAIIATEPQFRDQYGVKMAHAIDEILLSGDETTGTTNISYEGASIGSTSRFLTLNGLRHEPLVTTTGDSRDGGALTVDDFGSTFALMGTAGKFGVNPADLVIFSDPATWHKAKLLGEILTVDKFGSAATVVTGQLASLFGVPFIVSEDYSLTDATGRIDETAGDNTKGSFLTVNKMGVLVGWRRRPRIRVVGLPGAEARYIVGSARLDIQFKEAGMVAMSYNLTV